MNRSVKTIANFSLALDALRQALRLPILHDRDRAGIIQNFELCFETVWKALKEVLELENVSNIATPRAVMIKALEAKLIENEAIWLSILKDRNLTVHTYNQNLAEAVTQRISNQYFHEFEIAEKFLKNYLNNQKNI